MFVFVEYSAESITAIDVQMYDLLWICDRFGQRLQRSRVGQPAMGSMLIMELFVFV